jgi:hypothetical protein
VRREGRRSIGGGVRDLQRATWDYACDEGWRGDGFAEESEQEAADS